MWFIILLYNLCIWARFPSFQYAARVPLWSHYLTWEILIFCLEWEKCFLTVWRESCFTLHRIVRDTCILTSWMLFYECMCEAMWVRGVDRGLTMTLRGLLSHSPDQSNTVALASPGNREIYEKTATDSLKSSGEITTVFTSPPETCAKSSSCTSLRTGPLKATCECILCVWTAPSQDMLKQYVPVMINNL